MRKTACVEVGMAAHGTETNESQENGKQTFKIDTATESSNVPLGNSEKSPAITKAGDEVSSAVAIEGAEGKQAAAEGNKDTENGEEKEKVKEKEKPVVRVRHLINRVSILQPVPDMLRLTTKSGMTFCINGRTKMSRPLKRWKLPKNKRKMAVTLSSLLYFVA